MFSQLLLVQKILWLPSLFFLKEIWKLFSGIFQWLCYLDTFAENPSVRHQAVAANNLGNQGPSAIPETMQQHPLDAVVTSCSENSKSRKRRISEWLNVYYFTVIVVMKVLCFSVGRQDVRHGASGSLRKYGGMRKQCFKQARAVS